MQMEQEIRGVATCHVRIVYAVKTRFVAQRLGTKVVSVLPHLFAWLPVIAKRLHPSIVVKRLTDLRDVETLLVRAVYVTPIQLAVPFSGMPHA